MQFKSHLLAQATGSVAGVTYTRSAASQVIRNRSMPVTATSTAQTLARSILSLLANRWSNTLTDEQRQAWAEYAKAVPSTNRLGDTAPTTPKGAYIRANSARQQLPLGLPPIDDAPTTLNRGPLTVGPLVELHGGVLFPIDGPDEWWLTAGAYLISYVSPPQATARIYFNRTFSLARTWQGDPSNIWPTTRNINTPTPPTGWTTLFFRFAATYPDGRYVTSPIIRISRG